MKQKLLTTFVYIHIVGGTLLLLNVPIIAIMAAIGIPQKIYMPIFYSMLGFGVWSAIVLLVCMFLGIFPNATKAMEKAEKRSCIFSCFDELRSNLNSLLLKEYPYFNSVEVSDFGNVDLYARRESFNQIKCVTIARTTELNEAFLEQGNAVVETLLSNYCEKDRITDRIIMISFFCVDRVTPKFYDLVNKSPLEDYKVRYLPVGISFGGKMAYIANPKRHQKWYKRLREEVLYLLNDADELADNE